MKSKMSTQEFDKIYEKYKTLLYRIVFTYLKNDADVEDVLQEVFIKRFYHFLKFESEEHEKRWMIRIAVNLSKNHLKKFWNRNRCEFKEECYGDEYSSWKLEKRDKEIFDVVMSLPEKQRIVIYLHYYEGYSCKEIATILKCSESAIKMRLSRAREALKLEIRAER